MTSIKAFFAQRAKDMSRGDFSTFVAAISYPIVAYVGTRRLFFQDQESTQRILQTHCENLQVEGLCDIKADVIYECPGPCGLAQVFVEWRYLNAKGGLISQLDASYFVQAGSKGEWYIVNVELLREPVPRFSAGIPIE